MMSWHLADPNGDGVERNTDLSFDIRRNADIPLSDSVEDVAEFCEFNGYSVVAEGNTLTVTDENIDKIRKGKRICRPRTERSGKHILYRNGRGGDDKLRELRYIARAVLHDARSYAERVIL